jgi:AraC-like DNA-binding protein
MAFKTSSIARKIAAGATRQAPCAVSGNERTVFQPTGLLRDRIASIELVHNQGGGLTVLPTAGAVLGFQVRGRVRAGEHLLATAGITGILGSAREYEYAEQTISLLVRFTTQGAACLGVPVSALSDRSVALADLLPRARVGEVHERLGEAKSFGQSVEALQAFFETLPFARDRLVDRACELLTKSVAEGHVAYVAKSLALSERQLERRMLERVGVSPKRYATLRRFERAVALLGGASSLAQVAHEAGYYDQSHFIRDFRRLVGTSPGKYLRRVR